MSCNKIRFSFFLLFIDGFNFQFLLYLLGEKASNMNSTNHTQLTNFIVKQCHLSVKYGTAMTTDCRRADTHTRASTHIYTSTNNYLQHGGVHRIQEHPTLFWFITNVQQVLELLFPNSPGRSVKILRGMSHEAAASPQVECTCHRKDANQVCEVCF